MEQKKKLDIMKIAQLHRELHAADECHYEKADKLWVMETIHDLFLEHFDIELCWADCVWYAHTDSDMKVEDIGLCDPSCGYCKPNNSSVEKVKEK